MGSGDLVGKKIKINIITNILHAHRKVCALRQYWDSKSNTQKHGKSNLYRFMIHTDYNQVIPYLLFTENKETKLTWLFIMFPCSVIIPNDFFFATNVTDISFSSLIGQNNILVIVLLLFKNI